MQIISAPYILTMNDGNPFIQNGALAIDEGKIVDIGPREKIFAEYSNNNAEHFEQALIIPGLVNAHTHLDLLFYGAETQTMPDFFDWLMGGWHYRKNQTLSDRRRTLEEGLSQLIQSGTTCVGDSGEYIGLIPQAMNCPLRMVLFPELLTGGDSSIQDSYEAALAQIDEIESSKSPHISAGIAPYASYTLSRHLLKLLSEQALSMNIPIQIHVSETFAEMQFFYESSGEIATHLFPKMGWANQIPPAHRRTPIQYLESIGFLKAAPALVGCNHLAEPDIEIIAKTGSKVIHSPRANSLLKLGHPPLKKLLQNHIPVALGTNGTSSKFSLNLWEEMRFILEYYPENEKPSSQELLQMATIGGARALGLEDKIGSLENEKAADFLVIQLPQEVTQSFSPQDIPAWLIQNFTSRAVKATFIHGQKVKAS